MGTHLAPQTRRAPDQVGSMPSSSSQRGLAQHFAPAPRFNFSYPYSHHAATPLSSGRQPSNQRTSCKYCF